MERLVRPQGSRQGKWDVLYSYRQFFALEPDVLVLSLAMLAFSLAFQVTTRYLPEYLAETGASATIIGLFASLQNLISAVYPYPGGAISDRVGSRHALTVFGLVSSCGFAIWWLVPSSGLLGVPPWVWIFAGLLLVQTWKSFGLGATFALVKQGVPSSHLARGFASTELFRRVGFLLGPLIAAVILARTTGFVNGFHQALLLALVFAVAGTVIQHFLYDSGNKSFGKHFPGLAHVVQDIARLPATLRPLLVADIAIRFANGMAYGFFVIIVTQLLHRGVSLFGQQLSAASFFGFLLAIEMVVAILVMVPAAWLADRSGLKQVVAAGFLVYAVFPFLLVHAQASPLVLLALFAFSGLRFAGLPAHKALIVAPAAGGAGGTVTGTYYLLRNMVVIPAGVIGGWLFGINPQLSFTTATVVGLLGTVYFLLYGRNPTPDKQEG